MPLPEPKPCETCGSPIAWISRTGAVCCNCGEKPQGRGWYKAIVETNRNGKTYWQDWEKTKQQEAVDDF